MVLSQAVHLLGVGGECAEIRVKGFMTVPWDHSFKNLTLLSLTEPKLHRAEGGSRVFKSQTALSRQSNRQSVYFFHITFTQWEESWGVLMGRAWVTWLHLLCKGPREQEFSISWRQSEWCPQKLGLTIQLWWGTKSNSNSVCCCGCLGVASLTNNMYDGIPCLTLRFG